MPTVAEQLRAQSRVETLRDVLRMQLNDRFPKMTPHHVERIESATVDELEHFVKRIVSAETLDEVFAPIS